MMDFLRKPTVAEFEAAKVDAVAILEKSKDETRAEPSEFFPDIVAELALRHCIERQIRGGMLRRLAEVVQEIDDRLCVIEEKSMNFRGVFQRAADYARRDAVTHAGGLWVCAKDGSQQTPGEGSDWQLAVKSAGYVEART